MHSATVKNLRRGFRRVASVSLSETHTPELLVSRMISLLRPFRLVAVGSKDDFSDVQLCQDSSV